MTEDIIKWGFKLIAVIIVGMFSSIICVFFRCWPRLFGRPFYQKL